MTHNIIFLWKCISRLEIMTQWSPIQLKLECWWLHLKNWSPTGATPHKHNTDTELIKKETQDDKININMNKLMLKFNDFWIKSRVTVTIILFTDFTSSTENDKKGRCQWTSILLWYGYHRIPWSQKLITKKFDLVTKIFSLVTSWHLY